MTLKEIPTVARELIEKIVVAIRNIQRESETARQPALPSGSIARPAQEVAVGSARPSVTKKQREQKKRERQLAKAERRKQRKINAKASVADDRKQ